MEGLLHVGCDVPIAVAGIMIFVSTLKIAKKSLLGSPIHPYLGTFFSGGSLVSKGVLFKRGEKKELALSEGREKKKHKKHIPPLNEKMRPHKPTRLTPGLAQDSAAKPVGAAGLRRPHPQILRPGAMVERSAGAFWWILSRYPRLASRVQFRNLASLLGRRNTFEWWTLVTFWENNF